LEHRGCICACGKRWLVYIDVPWTSHDQWLISHILSSHPSNFPSFTIYPSNFHSMSMVFTVFPIFC
jgi:hypothetical protein